MPPPEPTPEPLSCRPTAFTLTPSRLTLVGPGLMGWPMSRRSAAALRAPHHFARQIGAVALNGDIHVIFKRQRDDVLRRQIQIAARE